MPASKSIKRIVPGTIAAAALLVLAASLLLSGCGGDGSGDPGVGDLMGRAQAAGEGIESYRMVLTMSVEKEGQDPAKTEELEIDIDGRDVRLMDTFYDPESGEGITIQEVIRAGDRQFRRDLTSEEWVEEEVSLSEEQAASYTSHIKDFLANSSSAENMGVESVNGVEAVRLRFEMSPENVLSLMIDVPEENLADNQGGQVDIWIDESDYYPVRYEILFRHALIGQEGEYASVRIRIDITDINRPLDITAPTETAPEEPGGLEGIEDEGGG
ncbi:MAG: hypothetical protein SWK76_04635 [Actinomycetota bacterium]|nr:hypothetical protein [Actinomycetota bacterium]